MTIREDPEDNEIRALSGLADFNLARVLEIGCGDARLTWRYAGETSKVIAIDPYEPRIRRARENMPAALRDRVDLRSISFEDFSSENPSAAFDIVLLSWSL
jgi:2-polyprenyl-3-methyl-5-hydroxy-6-metoxy-1,4-benzoquinol methylase